MASMFSRRPWIGPLIAVVVVYLFFVVLSPETFARPINLITMARQTVVVGIAATGATLVILLGGIDLSVGSGVALTTVIIASLLRQGFGPVTAALAGISVAALSGFANGAAITSLRIKPFVVTLGTMSILRGAAKGLAHEQKIDVDTAGLDALALPSKSFLLFPAGVWILVGVTILIAIALHFTPVGRHVFAIGSNERTARLCGVRVGWVKILVYTLAGALTGLAGLLEFSTLTVGDPTDSFGLELEVIASVVIGGGSLSGGEGSILGAVLGAFLMTIIKTGCTHLGLSNWVQELLTGGIIVLAVMVDRLRRREARD